MKDPASASRWSTASSPALGGRISLTSEPGRGTTVELCLPRRVVDSDAAVRSNEPELALGAGQRVLVVDDEPVVLSACQQLLMRLNYEVTACESPERALESAAASTRGV